MPIPREGDPERPIQESGGGEINYVTELTISPIEFI